MSHFISINDIENNIPEGNLNLPSDLANVREITENWIKGKLGSKYKVEEFDINVPIIKQLAIDYSRAYILTFNYVNTDFNEPANFFNSVENMITELNKRESNIFRSVKKENIKFNNNEYIIPNMHPRNIRITDDNGNEYFEIRNYIISYYYHTITNIDIPDIFNIEYEVSLRR